MYELWEIVSFDHMGEPQPFFLINSSESFGEIYQEFREKIKTTPCVILLKGGKNSGDNS